MDFVELIDELFESVYFLEDFRLGGTGPRFGLSSQLLEPVAENSLFLFVELEAFGVTMVVDLLKDFLHVFFDVFDHFFDFADCLFDFSVLDFANLNRLGAGFLNCL